jgi:hypothetical protein
VSEVSRVVGSLDPNMLAVLLLTVVLNGMFFYVYLEIANVRHVEFMSALNSCPVTSVPEPPRR